MSEDNTVILRSGPGKSHSRIDNIADGTMLKVISRDSGEYHFDADLDDGTSTWLKVSYKGGTGYINGL